MIIFTGVREKGHSVHPVCCTILIVTKALRHFPSALPSREISAAVNQLCFICALQQSPFVCFSCYLPSSLSAVLPSPSAPTFGSLQAKQLLKDRLSLWNVEFFGLSIYSDNIKSKTTFLICTMKENLGWLLFSEYKRMAHCCPGSTFIGNNGFLTEL